MLTLFGRASSVYSTIWLGRAEGAIGSSPNASGQVENQVGNTREQVFTPRLRCADYAELNSFLEARCLSQARKDGHPEMKEQTVWDVFQAEQPALIDYRGAFDGFHEKTLSVQKNCLVQFDRNRYSVEARAVGRTVQ